MAQLVGFYNKKISDPTAIDTEKQHTLGAHGVDESGNQYVYLQGVGSTVAGSWVSFNPTTGVATLLAADVAAPVAIAQAAVNSTSKYGWFMVYGTYPTALSDTVAGAGALLSIDGTAGRVDDAVVGGDTVYGAFATAADTTNALPVIINYPFTLNGVPA
jgi:hypothetical protein